MSQAGRKRVGELFPRVGRGARVRSFILLTLGLALTIALAVSPPQGWVPECPTHAYLGLYCPGCGSMRATHALLNGQIRAAFHNNPLLILIGVPLAIWFWAEQALVVVCGRRVASLLRSPRIAWAALFILLVFALLRNLPGAGFDWMRPPDTATGPVAVPVGHPI